MVEEELFVACYVNPLRECPEICPLYAMNLELAILASSVFGEEGEQAMRDFRQENRDSGYEVGLYAKRAALLHEMGKEGQCQRHPTAGKFIGKG